MTSACEVITRRTMIQCVRKDACEQRKETISTKGSMVANRLGCEQWLFQSPFFGQNKTVRRVIEVQRPCIMEWCHGGGDGMVKLTGKSHVCTFKKTTPKKREESNPAKLVIRCFSIYLFWDYYIYIILHIIYSYVLVLISKAFWCGKPNGIATIPATNHSRRVIFVHHRITRGIPNTKPELGIGAVSWVSLIRFTAFQNRCLLISRSGYSCKVGVWSNRPLSTIFLTSLSPLGKALMERCRKTYLRCSKTRCVMFFLQFLWETMAHFRNALSLPPVPLFKFPRRSKRKSGPVSGTSSFWSAPNMGWCEANTMKPDKLDPRRPGGERS